MDRGAWWATVHGVAEESDVTNSNNMNEGISDSNCVTYLFIEIRN